MEKEKRPDKFSSVRTLYCSIWKFSDIPVD